MNTSLRLSSAFLITAAIAGCSPSTTQGESERLAAANERIAKLEAELAALKAKPVEAAASAVVAKAASQPEQEEKPAEERTAWDYVATEDAMTGNQTYSAIVRSTNTVDFSSPYSGDQRGTLRLRSSVRHGKDVMFSIERGQIICHSYDRCNVLVRFDDGKPETYSGSGPTDGSSELVFLNNYERFMSKLRGAKTVRLSVDVYQQGSPVFEFDVRGFSQDKYIPKKR